MWFAFTDSVLVFADFAVSALISIAFTLRGVFTLGWTRQCCLPADSHCMSRGGVCDGCKSCMASLLNIFTFVCGATVLFAHAIQLRVRRYSFLRYGFIPLLNIFNFVCGATVSFATVSFLCVVLQFPLLMQFNFVWRCSFLRYSFLTLCVALQFPLLQFHSCVWRYSFLRSCNSTSCVALQFPSYSSNSVSIASFILLHWGCSTPSACSIGDAALSSHDCRASVRWAAVVLQALVLHACLQSVSLLHWGCSTLKGSSLWQGAELPFQPPFLYFCALPQAGFRPFQPPKLKNGPASKLPRAGFHLGGQSG